MPGPAVAQRLRQWPYGLKALLTVIAVGAAHGLGSWFIVIFRHEPLYVIWPGVGVGLAALHVFGRGFWPWLLVGGVATQAFSNGNFGLYTWLFPLVDTLESWLAATLLARARVDVTFPSVRDVGRYVLLAAIVPTLLGAATGLSVAVLSGDAYYHEPITWLHWWLADLQGMLHPATVLLTWAYAPPEGSRRPWPPSCAQAPSWARHPRHRRSRPRSTCCPWRSCWPPRSGTGRGGQRSRRC
jgi:integral membrane sensor domain MASE1